MTLDDAIKNYSQAADECRRKADIERNDYMDLRDLTAECEQLADWLNELKVLREKIQKLLEKQEQDRWVSVTERLPKPNTNVIMQCRAKGYKGKYRYFQTIGCYIPALTVKSEEKWNDDCEGVEIYDEKTDSFYCKEGWYEESTQGDGDYMSWYMGANVLAWRPLPETYTEEES